MMAFTEATYMANLVMDRPEPRRPFHVPAESFDDVAETCTYRK